MRSLTNGFVLAIRLFTLIVATCTTAVAAETAVATETGDRDGLRLATFSIDVTPPWNNRSGWALCRRPRRSNTHRLPRVSF
jgi:hypothetical protein